MIKYLTIVIIYQTIIIIICSQSSNESSDSNRLSVSPQASPRVSSIGSPQASPRLSPQEEYITRPNRTEVLKIIIIKENKNDNNYSILNDNDDNSDDINL